MTISKKVLFSTLGLATIFGTLSCNKQKLQTSQKPNIIIIYADDLGYGDVGFNGAIGVKTPNIDKLANNGLVFSDAHCSAATSTPSRYSLLTGEYAFRNKKAKILPGNAPLIIDTKKTTIASMLKKVGYTTGVVGKWHLGLGDKNLNWNNDIKPGPLEIGFDYCFLIPATGDRVPCVYVENHNIVGLKENDPIAINYLKKIGTEPTGKENPELLTKMKHSNGHNNSIVNGIGRIGFMTGGDSARWKDEDFADILTNKAKSFINKNKNNPFFLYFSFHDIHVPRVPNKRFVGKSTMGPRGDAIAQMDWCTGEIIKLLKKLNLEKNTLVIFTSDNGPVLDDGYIDRAVDMVGEHKPSGPFRGGKYSAYEAGTRMPFVTYWPGKIKPGKSSALISQIDFLASFAKLININLKPSEGIDSKDMLNVLLGNSVNGRKSLIEDSGTKSIRLGEWKYIVPKKGLNLKTSVNIEVGLSTIPQLYNLKNDIGEQNNIATKYPKKVKELKELLEIELNK